MKLIDNGILRRLIPEPGCQLYSQQDDTYYDIVYLSVNDSIDNYTEVVKVTKSDTLMNDNLNETINNIINE